EMRRPDAEAGRDRGDYKPDRAHVAGRSARVAQQIDRGERGQQANEGRQPDQPKVMGVSDAIIDFQHDRSAFARRYRDAAGLTDQLCRTSKAWPFSAGTAWQKCRCLAGLVTAA